MRTKTPFIRVAVDLGLLQMISEPDTGQCVSLLAVPRRGVDTRRCASKDAGLKGGWTWWGSHIELEKGTSDSEDIGPRREVDRDVPHWLERRTKTPFIRE